MVVSWWIEAFLPSDLCNGSIPKKANWIDMLE